MEFLKSIAAQFYRIGVVFRNWLYDMKILRGKTQSIPIVCVGNIAVGGTGKTPTVEFLVKHLMKDYTVAVLSRGYGRRTKGFREVGTSDSYLAVGDEPKQIKRKFPEVTVVVCEDRNEGVERLQAEHPEVNLVIMDDGFQHRSLIPKVNIVLSDYSLPPDDNRMLPAGTLRDTPSQLYRANLFLITKTPEGMSAIERNIAQKALHPFPYQTIYFTDMVQGEPSPIFSDTAAPRIAEKATVIALAGIANPTPFVEALKRRYEVVETILFPDHHKYRVNDVERILQQALLHGPSTMIVTTEKDGVKLTSRKRIPEELQKRLYAMSVELNFRDGDVDDFVAKLKSEINNR